MSQAPLTKSTGKNQLFGAVLIFVGGGHAETVSVYRDAERLQQIKRFALAGLSFAPGLAHHEGIARRQAPGDQRFDKAAAAGESRRRRGTA
jgi:hypothetical protein